MIPTRFLRVRLGLANGWLLRAREGAILVDAGFARREGRLARALGLMGLGAQDVRLVIVTHVHFDHVQGLAGIRRLTGAPVAVHVREADRLRAGHAPLPEARTLGARLARVAGRLRPDLTRFEPVEPDILLAGERDLAEWGLEAQLLETPGHTTGSVSVLTRDGVAFVGDLAANTFPSFLPPRASVFSGDLEAVFRGWQRLLDSGAHTFAPGHGPAFRAARLEKILLKAGPSGMPPA